MTPAETEARVARLEERLAWFERHVTAQDKAMLELSEAIQVLRKELMLLRERPGGSVSGAGELAAGDERPPHY